MAVPTTQRPPAAVDRTGWIAGGVLAVVLTLVGWLRHRNGWSGALDLGLFDQGVWLLSQGQAPEVTVNGRNLFADHLSPVLALFVPLYRLAASPVWLLAGQAAAIGAGLPAIRRFAANRGVATQPVTIAWVVSAALLSAALFDFHPSTLAVAPLAWLLVALDGERRWPVLLAAAGVILCRADLGWIVAATALVAPRRHRPTLLLAGVAGVALGAVVPAALGGEGTFEIHYGSLGDSPRDALLHPWRVVTAVGAADLATYGIWLLGGGLLALGAPRWALTVAVAGLPVLLSDWSGTESAQYHYGAPTVPLVLAGSVVAIASGVRWARAQYLVGGALLTSFLVGPVSPARSGAYSLWEVVSPRVGSELDRALDAVGPDEPVAATNRVLAHLTHREQAYGFPIPFESVGLSILYGGADEEAAAAIRVVIVEENYRDKVAELGFEIEDLGDLLVGRR